jgi:uncharacterized protein
VTDTVRVLGADHADELPAPLWDALVRDEDFFLSHEWMSVVEATGGVPTRYFLLTGTDGRPRAALSMALADASAPWTLGRPDTVLRSSVEQGLPGAADLLGTLPAPLLPAVVAGGRHVGNTRMLLSPEADGADINLLIDCAKAWAAEHRAKLLCFLYADEMERALASALIAQGFRKATSGRFSRLLLSDGGFAAYLDRFSAHRRRRILAERRALRAAGVRTTLSPLGEFQIARLAELETQLYHKYGITHWRAELSENFLQTMFSVLGERALVSAAAADGEIYGFGLFAARGSCWHALRSGFDYTLQGRLPVYFEALYYSIVEQAAEHGIRMVQYGLGSEHAKASRGCISTDQYSFVLPLAPPNVP